MTRRSLLRRTGLGVAALAALGTGAVALRAFDQGVWEVGKGPAYSPWKTWEKGTGLAPLVGAAVLAPSPHNAQAWRFGISSHQIDVLADTSRDTGALDPFHRELHVGLGAAIENLTLAARANGLMPTVTTSADGSRVASIHLRPAVARVPPLFEQIPRRHTNRYPFVADRDVPSAALAAMSSLTLPDVRLVWITKAEGRAHFGELLVAATEAIVRDDEQRASDGRWFRQDWEEIQRERDGVTIDAAGLPAMTAALAKLLPAQSPGDLAESWLQATRERHTRTASAYGLVAVRDSSSVDQRLRGGRSLQRVHLWATGAGLALHHMNQVTERADREAQLGVPATFGDAVSEVVPVGWEALSSFRIGFPTQQPPPSPRRPVESVVV